MLLKRLLGEYVFGVFLKTLMIKFPFLALPWVKPFFLFFANAYMKEAFEAVGTLVDFKIIDMEKAMADQDFKEVVLKVKEIDDSFKTIGEYDPDEIQRLRDEFHKKLNRVIDQSKLNTAIV